MPTYVLVHIKYLLILRTKLTWHLTCKTMLTHPLKIWLWDSIVLVLPECQVFLLLRYFCKLFISSVRNCLRHLAQWSKSYCQRNNIKSHYQNPEGLVYTVFPCIKAWAFISFPVFQTWRLNEGGFYLRPGVYF